MPVIKSAIKKMRQDEKRRAQNKAKKEVVKEALKKARKNPTPQNLSLAYSLLDKAAKTHLFHKNKVARLKSRLTKLVNKLAKEKGVAKTGKVPKKKTSPKKGVKKPLKITKPSPPLIS